MEPSEDTSEQPEVPSPASEDKSVAIISYLTLIGFIIAIILHGKDKTALGAYHLRQMMGLILTGIAAMIASFIPIIGLLAIFVHLGLFVLWIMGLIAAAGGEMKPVPLLGDKFQEWFKGTFE